MGSAGTLTYSTNLDTKGFQKGINDINGKVQSGGAKMKDIIASLGIAKLVGVAIGKINENIDSAINRLDTMNNFPKVMSNLGISAKESDAAIKDLSKGLKGLPTALDAGALAVQRFTSKNGDVKKSTDLFLALNNAILAGGANTQIQESAIEQLSQAYAKGKPDMMEWRTAQMAMPAQLKQISTQMLGNKDALNQYLEKAREYAKDNPLSSTAGELIEQLEAVSDGTGDMTTALGTGLRTGIISMDDFMDTIVQMNKTGTKNIKSFEEQARNATGGIKTNITNMNTAIARGIANVIKGIDKSLKKANLGGVGDVITNIGKKAEKVLNNIAKELSKIDFKKLMDTLKKLVPIVGAVVTAFIAYETSLKVIKGINIVNDIISATKVFLGLVPAITSATVSQNALNMAMSLNPIGLVVASVAALAAGLYFLSQKSNELTEAQKKEIEELERQTEEVNNNKKAWEDLSKSKQEDINSGLSEMAHYQALAKELSNITDENGKVKDGYEERANFIVNTLNDALGLEIKMTDGVISNYDNLRESIDKVIEKKKANILLEAQEELYKEALGQQATAVKKLVEYETTLNKNKEKSKEINEKLQTSQAEYYKILREKGTVAAEVHKVETEELQKKMIKQNEVVQKAEKNYNKQKDLVEGYAYAIGQYETNAALVHEEKYDEMSKVNWDYVKDLENVEQNKKDMLEQEKINTEKHIELLKGLKEKYNTDMFDSQIEADEKQLEEVNNNLKALESAVNEGENNVTNAYEEQSKKQVEKLDKKKEHKQKGKENMIEFESGMNGQKGTIQTSADGVVTVVIDELNKAESKSKNSGKNVGKGFAEGISSVGGQVASAARGIAKGAIEAMKKEADIHSPSKKTRELGIYFDEGLKEGIKDGANDVYKEVETFSDGVLNRFSDAVNFETGNMSFSGTSGSVSQILSANAQFEGTIPLRVDLDGEKIYDNQQKIRARKSLQYGGVK